MKRLNLLGVLVMAAVFMTSVARAEETAMDMNKSACKADADKLCAGVQPAHGAIRDCLKQHEAELSAGCKSNIAVMKEKMKEHKAEIQAACKADTDQFCKDVTPGEGREMACLHAHNDKISAGCREVVEKHRRNFHHAKSDAPSGMMEKK